MLFHTFLFVFLAEMADKTQLMIMALTNRYSVKTVIAGMILGVFAISGVSVLAGDLIGDLIPMRLIKLAASAMFLFFGLMNLRRQHRGRSRASCCNENSRSIHCIYLCYRRAW